MAVKFPPHKGAMIISHNDHKTIYQSLSDYLRDHEYEPGDWVSDEQRQKSLQTGELWEMIWYPDSPVGHCVRLAAEFEELFEEET